MDSKGTNKGIKSRVGKTNALSEVETLGFLPHFKVQREKANKIHSRLSNNNTN